MSDSFQPSNRLSMTSLDARAVQSSVRPTVLLMCVETMLNASCALIG